MAVAGPAAYDGFATQRDLVVRLRDPRAAGLRGTVRFHLDQHGVYERTTSYLENSSIAAKMPPAIGLLCKFRAITTAIAALRLGLNSSALTFYRNTATYLIIGDANMRSVESDRRSASDFNRAPHSLDHA